MNINFLKKAGIVITGTLATIYILFLVLPFIISPIANNYLPIVNDEIKKATGLNSEIKDFRIVTTPKLTIGAKLSIEKNISFNASIPDESSKRKKPKSKATAHIFTNGESELPSPLSVDKAISAIKATPTARNKIFIRIQKPFLRYQ